MLRQWLDKMPSNLQTTIIDLFGCEWGGRDKAAGEVVGKMCYMGRMQADKIAGFGHFVPAGDGFN